MQYLCQYTISPQKFNLKFTKIKFMTKQKGFTLIELLIVIAIIGILASVVMVNSKPGVDKAKRASALTTAASIMQELVSCADDGGVAKSTPPVAGNPVCCTDGNCTAAFTGHTITWPDITTKTGWAYGAVQNTLAAGTYQYTLTKTDETTITCRIDQNTCE